MGEGNCRAAAGGTTMVAGKCSIPNGSDLLVGALLAVGVISCFFLK